MKNAAKVCYSAYRQVHRPSQVMILFYLLAGGLFCFAVTCPVEAATYYCDPNGNNSNDGSAAHPWGTLQSAIAAGKFGEHRDEGTIKSGDTVKLNTGFHGRASFRDSYPEPTNEVAYITIESNGTAIADVNSMAFGYCHYWHIKGIRMSPSFSTPSGVTRHNATNSVSDNVIIDMYNDNHIIIEDCNIFTVADSSGWDANDWTCKVRSASHLTFSDNINWLNNHVKNICRGISGASNSTVSGNTIDGFSEDAMRISGPNSIIQDNIITNSMTNTTVSPNDWHVDAMQQAYPDNGNNMIIRRNYICSCTDPNRTSTTCLQGMFLEVDMNDSLIENNVVVTMDNAWGIGMWRAFNTKILNNTVLGTYGRGQWPPISFTYSGSSNATVRNNIANNFPSGAGVTADHNFDISNYNPDVEFVDYAHGNVRLRAGSHFIDAGSSLNAPAEDLDRNSRPRGQGYDVGAYEYIVADSNNRAPILQEIGNKSVNENALLTFTVTATDPDGDTVTYSYSGLPAGASFSSQTFNWTPTYAQTGTYQVTFIAGDGQAQDSETI
ncbi:MAG: putative Ig domain-containing protein, partial [Planctomycetota bacterium]|nr:putative Ig domain-containing protein [Planctomycetota bacterium]